MGEIRENKMGTAPVTRLLISMSWPAIVSMLIQALYNVVDSVFVARTGEAALTALTLVNPAQMVLVAVGVGTGVGVNSLVSRRLGAKRFDEANAAASVGLKISFISWSIFLVFGLFFSKMFISVFTEDQDIITQGRWYLTIVMVFSIFTLMQMIFEKTIQSTGNMIFPMLSSIAGCVINIILDPILIFGYFGIPAMGVIGAAVATVFGQSVSLVITFIVLFKVNKEVKIDFRTKLTKQLIKEIYAVGLPSILMQMVLSVANVFINYILAGFSDTAVAVMGAYARLQGFVFMPCFGLNQGSTPIFGYNYGARNKKRLMKALRTSMTISVCIMFCGLLIFQLMPEVLLSAFDASPQMVEIGVPAFRIISICFLPAAIGISSGGMFAATGHGVISLVSSLVRQLVFIVPLAYIFSLFGELARVWWAFPLSEIFGLSFIVTMLMRVYKHDISKLDDFSKETAEEGLNHIGDDLD